MGKSKKKLDDLKKDLKTLQKKDMKKIVGGKNDNKKKPKNLNKKNYVSFLACRCCDRFSLLAK